MSLGGTTADRGPLTIGQKLWQISWSLVFLLILLAAIGFAMLYSAASGEWDPWASRQAIRFGIGLVLMIAVAVTDIQVWMRYAYTLYFIVLALLISVEVMGVIGMGAQRWISLGFIQLQPSEIMKITLVLALARYFHGATLEEIARPTRLVVPLLLLAAPVILVLRQPDLGTAIMLSMSAGVIFFLAGVRAWKFAVVIGAALAALPVAWTFLHSYQKKRILTFLDPESDPLGAGYHILQSKIALGSGGMFGKGFLNGTQSHLNFLPEKQTDFIFTMLAEEFGMAGGLILIGIYILVIIYGFAVSLRVRNQFGRLISLGIIGTFFFYVFINIAMVMGLVPVVGIPLPLVSYGGTAMLSLMIGFGFIMCAYVHRDVRIGRHSSGES
ncbi:MAG: rod shape-determining protein RodA [Rhodospirillaceae bacterium]|jgi:rod shape determining protein RodA|nr:rod shape-determining protein RodA [Rhodospirillaceae bacterium]MBT5459511.1 rod shape-determining protein RodA [Rhodospirillaceae bacterium]